MPVTVTCECGHVTELADPEQPDAATAVADRVCPICGRPLRARVAAGKRMFQQLWQSHAGDASDTSASASHSEERTTSEPTSEPTPARRSLWQVMRGSPATPRDKQPAATISGESPATESPAAEAAKPKGLWGVMPAPTSPPPVADIEAKRVETIEVARTEVVSADSVVASASPPASRELTPEQKYAQAAGLASMTHVQSSWHPEPEPEPFDEDEREWSRRALAALGFAVAAAGVPGLSYRPEWWWRFPALALGLIAVVLGFIASSDVRLSRGRLKGRWAARVSVLIGAAGMFLAPMVFAGLGERSRENARREQIEGRLRRIGQALEQFHAQQGHYPEAALKGRDVHGDNVPMHGWMTPLLPALGYEAIHRQIDLRQPYDALANTPAMQQSIPEFTLPRRKQSRSPRGFSLTHFAGVGGQDVREPTGLVHLGLFSDGGPSKQADFTDGLSQTIIVGEIRDAFPPWGEPGNVRAIGDGLNRQFRGFGNENGTGATFLHADGSVKFYSNKTDQRVLQRLETRDGAEPE